MAHVAVTVTVCNFEVTVVTIEVDRETVSYGHCRTDH